MYSVLLQRVYLHILQKLSTLDEMFQNAKYCGIFSEKQNSGFFFISCYFIFSLINALVEYLCDIH